MSTQFLETLEIAAEKRNRVNAEIVAESVRLISESGEQVGIVGRAEALNIADEVGLDLVEISPNMEPPVCRLMDFGKFLFQQNKRRAATRKKQAHVQVKEIKFRPGTEEADYQTKLRNLKRFLSHGDKTKVTLWFRGREMRHQELGAKLLKRVEADLQELAKVEQYPRMEGRRLSMVLTPRKMTGRAASAVHSIAKSRSGNAEDQDESCRGEAFQTHPKWTFQTQSVTSPPHPDEEEHQAKAASASA